MFADAIGKRPVGVATYVGLPDAMNHLDALATATHGDVWEAI